MLYARARPHLRQTAEARDPDLPRWSRFFVGSLANYCAVLRCLLDPFFFPVCFASSRDARACGARPGGVEKGARIERVGDLGLRSAGGILWRWPGRAGPFRSRLR